MVGDKVLNYGPGESVLTPIDLPIVAHITRATKRGTVSRTDVQVGHSFNRPGGV
jgi:hypothetical protein